MTPIIIRAVPERHEAIAYLKHCLPDAQWVVDAGEQRSAYDSFIKALRLSVNRAVVLMEEDVVLTVDFRSKLEQAIAEQPDRIIQFFSRRALDLDGPRKANEFWGNQCTYYPFGYTLAIAAYVDASPWRHNGCAYDLAIGDWLKERHEWHWIFSPNLVDHREGRSAIDRRRSSRRHSRTFVNPWIL